ncbi:MAG: UDP-N-acetylmuramoyl-L-alanyl-D-glutamate--2,6-diaminopimelate ligase [Hydrogenoanaerobacterium sp.]
MTLYELLNGIKHDENIKDCEVVKVTCDNREVVAGTVFVCIKGQKFDGHDVAQKAVESGASLVVCEKDVGLPQQLVVANTREAYGIMCGNFYGNPAGKLKLIGITGTNGKTTISYLVKQLLEDAGKRVGLIGTIHNEIGEMNVPATHTTPDPSELHVLFSRMALAGCEYVVMEVSSHALDQHRLAGCHFDVGVFTNLTQDHLDYHGTMENYYAAKKSLFDICGTAVINIDDEYGLRLTKEVPCKVLTFSTDDDNADFIAKNIYSSATGSRFALVTQNHIGRVNFCMPGKYSVSNALAAGVAALAAGVSFEEAVKGLCECKGVTGRTELIVAEHPFTIIRDYAHTPDGLEKIIESVREYATGRIITLFGCAGNRDRSKRPKMAEIVARLSDYVILTSDNPRDEDPLQIINDAVPGFLEHKTPYKILPNRYEAIEYALDFAKEGDILLLCGKGHEDYQVLDFGTICFDEKEIVLRMLKEKGEIPK